MLTAQALAEALGHPRLESLLRTGTPGRVEGCGQGREGWGEPGPRGKGVRREEPCLRPAGMFCLPSFLPPSIWASPDTPILCLPSSVPHPSKLSDGA